jgi:hypothetical protein
MPRIHLHLQEGFADDPVKVVANGRVVYERPDVTTNLSSSLADTATFDAPAGAAIEVELPDLGLVESSSVPSDAGDDVYVTASLSRDRARLETAATGDEPMYM